MFNFERYYENMGELRSKKNSRLAGATYNFSARELGAIAYFEGKTPQDNPYSPLDIEHDDWLAGYIVEVELVSNNFDECFGAPTGTA